RRLEGFVQRAAETVGDAMPTKPPALKAAFVKAMDDDLNTPKAVAIIHDLVREGNIALGQGEKAVVKRTLTAVRSMLGVLGLDPLSPRWWVGSAGAGLREVVDSLVSLALEQRASARARKDWTAADAVRDRLKQAGVVVEDTASGPRWTIEG